jgi:hypothetical protein
MGTRINVCLDHDLPDYRDREATLARLRSALQAALAVHDYWVSVNPERPPDRQEAWEAEPMSERQPYLRRYSGPGSLFLTVAARAATIRTGGRWRGFLTIEALRRVHLAAFWSIGIAMGARSLILFPDSDEVCELLLDEGNADDCRAFLKQKWGQPQASLLKIEPEIAEAADRTVPLVWFVENIARKRSESDVPI